MTEYRYYCRLYPCVPPDAGVRFAPDAWNPTSFATVEAYDRHLEKGHFIAKGSPFYVEPYTVARLARVG